MSTWLYARRKEGRFMKMEKIEPIVKRILETYPEARDDDDILMYWYCKEIGFDLDRPFKYVLLGGGPNRDSITRVRRKIQERHEELRATEPKRRLRKNAELEWKEYSRK